MEKIRELIRLIAHGHYDTGTEEGRSKERVRNIALTAATAMLAKVLAMIVPFITVRLTLTYMGEEIYGLWTAVVAFFTVFAFADLGLGSGLQTEMSRASALDDKTLCKKLVSSCYVILTVVSLGILFFFFIGFPFVNWARLVNAETQEAISLAGGIVMAIVVSKIINIPLGLIQRTQLAMQEGYKSNLWNCLGSVLSLVFIFSIYFLDLGILTMIWAAASITVIVAFVNMLYYFKFERPELRPRLIYFDRKISNKLLNTGVMFLVLSIFTSISLTIDNFIVAHACNLTEVTPYSIMYKIVTMIGVVSAMFSSPMWSANGEALQRGEYKWVEHMTNKIAFLSLLFSLACSLGIFLLIKPALIVLTDNIVVADYNVLMGMCILQILISFTNPYFMILNGAGIIKFQIVNYIIYALVSLPLKYILGIQFGATAIAWTGTLTYLLLLTIPTMYKSISFLKKAEVKIVKN